MKLTYVQYRRKFWEKSRLKLIIRSKERRRKQKELEFFKASKRCKTAYNCTESRIFNFREPRHSNTFWSWLFSAPGWRIHRARDTVELVCDNNFDTLSEHGKYIVLKNKFAPEANFDLPKTIKHGCNRSNKTAYLSGSFFSSCQDNAVYCIYCVLCIPKDRRNNLLIVDTMNGTT